MVTAMAEQFNAQRDQILAHLDTSKIGKAFFTGISKKSVTYTRKDWLQDLLDWAEAAGSFKAAIEPIIHATLLQAGQDASQAIGTTFDPFTPAIVEYFQNRSTKVAKDVTDETEKQLRAALSQGVLAGESTYELRARVESVMGSASTMRADRIARTEVSRAQGYGDIQAWSQSGLVAGKEFYTARDELVCLHCRSLDGKTFDLSDNIFDKGDSLTIDGKTQHYNYDDIPSPPLHVNCVAGDSEVIAPDSRRLIRSFFTGDLVKIRLTGGSILTVTPNHPVLTERGFIAAKFIDKSYKLIRNIARDSLAGDIPDNDLRVASIAEVFSSLDKHFGMSTITMPVTSEDFHGDGKAINGNVDIVNIDRFLIDDLVTSRDQKLANFFFNVCRRHDALSPSTTLSQCLMTLAHAFDSGMSGSDLATALSRSSSLPESGVSLTSPASYDARILKSQHDGVPGDAIAVGETLNGLTGLVALDDVLGVEISSVHGIPVYDVETTSTVYTTNGYIVSNCRCTLLPVRD